ncbi:KfrC [Sphingomonas sp. Leaf208]|uniref:IncP plasmid survival protein KfrC family protein n=1 Tax=Sphingomonas sp. Leaf208 TaxID=1735679 RepID=UPI0006F931A7|nr:IncP plasmid survival protein KfrC family protein [Sphingomonas sp. Leaf208]KQM54699.1 KfrC [Sphingomonas sp. Leaf208]
MAGLIDSNKQPLSNGTGDPIADADGLLGLARGIEAQEAGEIAAPAAIEEEYAGALVQAIEEKQDQASQIEDRLENMIEAQSARLQHAQAHPPGMLATASTRAKWQAQVAQQQATIQLLQSRLETVREIRDGITVHGSKIEALAAEKVAHRDPKLADDFAELQEARRLHEIHMRQQQGKKQEERQGLTQEAAPSAGLSLSRGLSHTRAP